MERKLKIKRIKFLASRRASSEIEVFLKDILENINLEKLPEKEIDGFLDFLNLNDVEIKEMIYGKKDVPPELKFLEKYFPGKYK